MHFVKLPSIKTRGRPHQNQTGSISKAPKTNKIKSVNDVELDDLYGLRSCSNTRCPLTLARLYNESALDHYTSATPTGSALHKDTAYDHYASAFPKGSPTSNTRSRGRSATTPLRYASTRPATGSTVAYSTQPHEKSAYDHYALAASHCPKIVFEPQQKLFMNTDQVLTEMPTDLNQNKSAAVQSAENKRSQSIKLVSSAMDREAKSAHTCCADSRSGKFAEMVDGEERASGNVTLAFQSTNGHISTSSSKMIEERAMQLKCSSAPTSTKSPQLRKSLDLASVERDGTITIGYRPTNIAQRRSERVQPLLLQPAVEEASSKATAEHLLSDNLLAQVIDLSIQSRPRCIAAAHDVIAGPHSLKPVQDNDLTALPACNANKPLPPLRFDIPDNAIKPVPIVSRHVPVNPPLYNPLEISGHQWLSNTRHTSRPVDVWGAGKRWTCCECEAQTMVEQQICSKLCCQHARCQRGCRMAPIM